MTKKTKQEIFLDIILVWVPLCLLMAFVLVPLLGHFLCH